MINKLQQAKQLLLILVLLFTTTVPACYSDYTMNNGNLDVLHEKTFKIKPGKMLRVDGASGDVYVKTWNNDKVYIKILGNEKAQKRVDFTFDNNDDYVEVIAKRRGSFSNWFSSNIHIRFEIIVPSNFNTKIHTSGGDINVSDIEGDNELKTSGGDIWAKALKGNLFCRTSGGDIHLNKSAGGMNVSTSGGDIEGRDFYGELKASTSGGDIQLESGDAKIYANTSGGDISLKYNGPNKGIELGSSGGDIVVRVPADFNAAADLHTSGGDIECNITTNNIKKISSSKFIADLNNGGDPLIIRTSGGDITVMKN